MPSETATSQYSHISYRSIKKKKDNYLNKIVKQLNKKEIKNIKLAWTSTSFNIKDIHILIFIKEFIVGFAF